MKATFICNILKNDTDEIIEEYFKFDSFEYSEQSELDKYMKSNQYEIGEICGYWGNDRGILIDIVITEE